MDAGRMSETQFDRHPHPGVRRIFDGIVAEFLERCPPATNLAARMSK